MRWMESKESANLRSYLKPLLVSRIGSIFQDNECVYQAPSVSPSRPGKQLQKCPNPRQFYALSALRSGHDVSQQHGNEADTKRKIGQKGRFLAQNPPQHEQKVSKMPRSSMCVRARFLRDL
jgi:hypothetical protein